MRSLARSMLLPACSLAALALTDAASAQTAVTFHPGPTGQIEFAMPSQNIGCVYTPAGGTATYRPFDGGPELSCDRIAPSYVRVVLTRTSLRRFDNPGDQGCCNAGNVFPTARDGPQARSSASRGKPVCSAAVRTGADL